MCDEIKYAYLKSHPLFAKVADEKLKDWCSQVKIKTIYRGQALNYGEGLYSKIFLLITGKVKITQFEEQNSENELVKDILTAPDIFGDLSLEGQLPTVEFAEALTANTVVGIVNVAEFRNLLHNNVSIAMTYAKIVNNKLKKIEDRHADLLFLDARTRLIRFIKKWAASDGNRVGGKIILNNYLTHSEIASVISTTRQSVNTLLNELRDSGLLFYNRKRIELNDFLIWN